MGACASAGYQRSDASERFQKRMLAHWWIARPKTSSRSHGAMTHENVPDSHHDIITLDGIHIAAFYNTLYHHVLRSRGSGPIAGRHGDTSAPARRGRPQFRCQHIRIPRQSPRQTGRRSRLQVDPLSNVPCRRAASVISRSLTEPIGPPGVHPLQGAEESRRQHRWRNVLS